LSAHNAKSSCLLHLLSDRRPDLHYDSRWQLAHGVGDVQLDLVGAAPVILTNILYVPMLRGNHISVAQLASRRITVHMGAEAASTSCAGAVLACAKFTGHAYVLVTAWRSQVATEQTTLSMRVTPAQLGSLMLHALATERGSSARTHHLALAAMTEATFHPGSIITHFTHKLLGAIWATGNWRNKDQQANV
jgi:hypothetical protein